MKPKLCFVGYKPLITLAKKAAREFQGIADFLFIFSVMEEALPLLREIEGVAQIILAGPSTRRMYAGQLKIPIISFRPTFPDLVRAIQEAQKIDNHIAICLSRDDREFDLPLLSEVMNVSLYPLYCDNSKEYEGGCRMLKEKGYKVVIGGSFTIEAAKKIGVKGILLYKGMDMIRSAIKNALEICQVQRESIRSISQLSAVVNNFGEGLLLTDEKGQIILDNPPSQKLLGSKRLQGKKVTELFQSKVANRVLSKGQKNPNVLEKDSLVVNYMPVRSTEGIHGLVCTFKRVDEVQDAEFAVRKKLHNTGFVAKYILGDIIGESTAIRECKERATLFAVASDPIFITGDSGTGKELFAHAIHKLSQRVKGPFVAINCATLPNELLESELFGYEKGAFTGARTAGKKGLIELAHNGTLFLDEITTLSYQLQAKLLRLLSEHEMLKLGSDRIIPVDVRILAATNVDIESFVEERRFREDLYYRLNVFRLHIPPLRERPEDIVLLFLHFVSRIRPEITKRIAANKRIINKVLANYVFKGNARELENIARRFCLLYKPEKSEQMLGDILGACLERGTLPEQVGETLPDLKTALQYTEKQIIQDLLRKNRKKSDIARSLDVAPSTLWRKLKKYGIQA